MTGFRADAIYEEIYGLNNSLNRCPARSRGKIHRQMAKLVAEYEALTGSTWQW